MKLLTDHKPLITLFGEHKPVRQLAAARIKRWALLLAAYDYTIEFISGKDNVYADFLSRKPMNTQPSSEEQVTVNVKFNEGDRFLIASVAARKLNRTQFLAKGCSILRRVGPITPSHFFNLTSVEGLTSPIKRVSSYGNHKLLFERHYRASY